MSSSQTDSLLSTQNVSDLLDIWKSRAKPVVIWAGAGLSAPAKLPTWLQLKERLVSEVIKRSESQSEREKKDNLARLKTIDKLPSLWKQFEQLEDMVGPATFQATIRASMADGLRCVIPTAYVSMWDLGIQGMMTLNIDQLAQRAYHKSVAGSNSLHYGNGFSIRTLVGTLTDTRSRFIASLHGSFEEPDSWVFTERKLNALLTDETYTEFVGDCIKYAMIVLMGVSAQDRAVLEHFTKISSRFPNSGPHFWVTDASQSDAAALLERAGVRSILYPNRDGTHSFLPTLLEKLKAYTPPVTKADPVIPQFTGGETEELPLPNELIRESPNKIRALMNSRATVLLSPEDDSSYSSFETFCTEYARAIHSTTFFSKDPSEDANRIGAYFVDKYVKEGGFAKVWYGHDQKHNPVAIKVFRHEVREQKDLLQAFRRGVRSMRHLANKNLSGVVKFLDAAEIPPVVIMEWVDGITLYEAVKQGTTKEWSNCLRIARDLARACFEVHNTPERVIHRDLRPQNIMLRDYYSEPTEAEVVVLDFDLSWHLGAHEKSVYISGGTAYLAPEQLAERPGVSTRSAAVDSYGFGMTLYYMVSGSDPEFFAHARPNWTERIEASCVSRKCKEWHSLPKRVARLIQQSTIGEQNKRMTFGQVTSEIEKLYKAITDPNEITDVGYLSEEVFSRVPQFSTYVIADTGACSYNSPSGLRYSIKPNSHDPGFDIQIAFTQAGHEKFQSLHAIREEFGGIVDKFSRKAEIIQQNIRRSHGDFSVDLVIAFDGTPGYIDNISNVFADLATRFTNLMGI